MSLSGNQVTRLWPHGMPGFNYGSFAGKAEQEIPEPYIGHVKRTFTIQRQDRSFDAPRVSRVGTIKRRDRL